VAERRDEGVVLGLHLEEKKEEPGIAAVAVAVAVVEVVVVAGLGVVVAGVVGMHIVAGIAVDLVVAVVVVVAIGIVVVVIIVAIGIAVVVIAPLEEQYLVDMVVGLGLEEKGDPVVVVAVVELTELNWGRQKRRPVPLLLVLVMIKCCLLHLLKSAS
jgi:hypothetical protein